MAETKEMVEVNQPKSWDEALEQESWIAPLVDIYETNDDYFLTAVMPGVKKENVKIKLEEITGSFTVLNADEPGYHHAQVTLLRVVGVFSKRDLNFDLLAIAVDYQGDCLAGGMSTDS